MCTQSRTRIKGTILIVDDSSSERILIREYLTAAHPQLKLLEAPNGTTAFQIMSCSKVTLVILDYRLQLVNGLEVLKHLIDEHQVPVIMVTDVGSKDIALEAMKMGALDYITKSIGYHKGLPMIVERHLLRLQQSVQQRDGYPIESLMQHARNQTTR